MYIAYLHAVPFYMLLLSSLIINIAPYNITKNIIIIAGNYCNMSEMFLYVYTACRPKL